MNDIFAILVMHFISNRLMMLRKREKVETFEFTVVRVFTRLYFASAFAYIYIERIFDR
jgi:hypothetical protein